MTWVVIDLLGDEKTEEVTSNKEAAKLEPPKDLRDRQLQQQVINIHGEVVTI